VTIDIEDRYDDPKEEYFPETLAIELQRRMDLSAGLRIKKFRVTLANEANNGG